VGEYLVRKPAENSSTQQGKENSICDSKATCHTRRSPISLFARNPLSQRFAHLPFQYSRITNTTRGWRKSPTSANSSLTPLRLGAILIRVVVRFICLQ